MNAVFPVRPLCDLATSIEYGVTASASAVENGTKFLRITDIQNGRVDWQAVPFCEAPPNKIRSAQLSDGDIVFARTGATTGKSFLVQSPPDGAVFASYLIRVRPSARVNPSYLAHFFQSNDYWSQIRRKTQGAAQGGVNATSLSEIEIPLPPLDEQRRIAAILDKADALRRKRKGSLDLLDGLTQSIYLHIFGDPLDNPNTYPLFQIYDIAETRLGKMLDTSRQSSLPKFKYLANANVQWGRFELSDLKTMGFSAEDRVEFSLRAGDLLVCEGGEIGRCAIWREEFDNCYFQKALHRLRCDTERILPEILEFYFKLMAKNGGLSKLTTVATIAHLTAIKLRTLRVPVPPMKDQMKFVAAYNQVAEQKSSLKGHLGNVEVMFRSLQSRAFSGQL